MPRGNPQNLKPNKEGVRTKEERKALARKAGLASGKARRERKTLREDLLALLSAGNTQKDMNLAIIAKALEGDTRAYEIVRDTIGEKPADKIIVAEVSQDIIDDIEKTVLEDDDDAE